MFCTLASQAWAEPQVPGIRIWTFVFSSTQAVFTQLTPFLLPWSAS